jgi:formamidopyrimidine-DNA glycosylase
MPELPEVEFTRGVLARWLAGRRVDALTVLAPKLVAPSAQKVAQALAGQRFLGAERRAKYLLLSFTGDVGLVSHLGMTGRWTRRPAGEALRHDRLQLALDDGHVLHFQDMRMFGWLELHPASALATLPVIAALGPDPLRDGLDGPTLQARLAGSKRAVKVALMDQAVVAGIGNIQAAEALFRAKVDPRLLAGALTAAQCAAVAKGVHQTIAHTLASQGSPQVKDEIAYVEEGGENPFLVYDRRGEPCPVCRTPLARLTQGGRSTYWCPGCQAPPA